MNDNLKLISDMACEILKKHEEMFNMSFLFSIGISLFTYCHTNSWVLAVGVGVELYVAWSLRSGVVRIIAQMIPQYSSLCFNMLDSETLTILYNLCEICEESINSDCNLGEIIRYCGNPVRYPSFILLQKLGFLDEILFTSNLTGLKRIYVTYPFVPRLISKNSKIFDEIGATKPENYDDSFLYAQRKEEEYNNNQVGNAYCKES